MSARKCPPRCNGTGGTPTNRKEKQMHSKNTPLGNLVAELDTVTAAIGVAGHWHWSRYISPDGTEQHSATAFVTSEFSGPDVDNAGASYWIEGEGPTRAMALEDVLEKITASAPQQVSA